MRCPALLIAAPASGQGKTTLTAALARYHARQGRKVRVFKTGPDFLDPMLLAAASGQPVYQIDLWMVGEEACRGLLFQAAQSADLLLVEGAMGLFDGTPSSADLAEVFGLPVLASIDASAMVETFGAVAQGLATYRSGLSFAGVAANRVASSGHAELLRRSLPAAIPWRGALSARGGAVFPERHLGLVQAGEIHNLDRRLDELAEAVADTPLAELPEPVVFRPAFLPAPALLLEGVRIGVARDAAFSFLYPANLDVLRDMGAELVFFSPLRDYVLPEVDSIYLPGGYPELHLDTLSANREMKEALLRHAAVDRPFYAECGGMLYLLDELEDHARRAAPLCGILPGRGRMQERLAGLGLQSLQLPEGELRGHTFHYSHLESPLPPVLHCRTQHGDQGEAVYRRGRLTASYLHAYFPSCPEAVAGLFLP